MTDAPGVLIRAYRDEDKPAVRALFVRVDRELAPEGLRAEFEDYIERSQQEEINRIPAYYYGERDGSYWVADEARVLVGMYGLERVDPQSAEVRRMYVAPEARGRGVARAMLDQAERICREAGLEMLVLSTSELQRSALALYRASGFQFLREEVALARANKVVGSGLRRFDF